MWAENQKEVKYIAKGMYVSHVIYFTFLKKKIWIGFIVSIIIIIIIMQVGVIN
jgi:hypothetical protein